jgi:hypothetical protein
MVQHQFVTSANSEFGYFCRISEEYEGCRSGKNNESFDIKFGSCTMKMCHITPSLQSGGF